MKTIKTLGVALTGILLLSAVAVSAGPGSSDAWIGTKGKIALLTTDGAGRTAVRMDTVKGRVTLHGKVESQQIRAKAEATIRKIDGVKSVKNLIQVVPDSMEKRVDASDKDIKDRVEQALRANQAFADVHVDSVDNGVVLLSGETQSWLLQLEAIEAADRVAGARRVASLIKTDEKIKIEEKIKTEKK